MTQILITGAAGFIGSNLRVALGRRGGVSLDATDVGDPPETVRSAASRADVVFHLAGVNRPHRDEEFETGNVGALGTLVEELERLGRSPLVVLSSSTQVLLDNPYGRSKRRAEGLLRDFSARTGAPVRIFRLPGVFGKWCRPNYNSVVATFSHNLARGLPIVVADPDKELELVYVDDVVGAFLSFLEPAPAPTGAAFVDARPTYRVTVGRLAELLRSFSNSRSTLQVPDFGDPFVKKLYAAYLSYLPGERLAYALTQRSDRRGTLAELLKSPPFGQIFVSRTMPGVTRGNHYHDTKTEKFYVIEGDAVIRFRHLLTGELVEVPVSGSEFRVVDIPPGWAHSIENVGKKELIVLFWACEVFDPDQPDAHPAEVTHGQA